MTEHAEASLAPSPEVAFDFQGRTVFVAGGSSGINLSIAEAFARRGARVGIASRSPERVAAAVERLRSHGGRAEGWSADVRDADSIGAALAAAHEAFGPIDVLVSGAAGNFVAPALGMSSKGFRTVIDIDLVGTFNVLRSAHEFLRRPGASVINISAPQAANPTPYQAHVCAAKAGVDMLTRVLAMEWGADGVRVNSIVPGPIGDTEGVRRLAPSPEALAAMAASIPLGRFGRTEDVALMALMLSSPWSSFVTGAVIPVDGGSSLAGGRDLGSALKPAP
ncbi:NAD(P)-dependent dehydrogenase (short-subunit alcohol dehydrogenase family) [Variovorax paradoxus]|uniref:SDR family oxidoreductase n=1 Tax=Variovorax paradoxus TaxID=34073 RepID=UPI00279072E5|nr:SDR family oxidoreductase [Variovorax paradoxus]MDQ0570429.1 NAD(P)-dependent dehydrogenase (short-subunit alcohol dehydrogenase family) [Variovorax paradoxus]